MYRTWIGARLRRGAVLPLLLIGACQSGSPVSEAQLDLEHRRLLRPFLTDREVGCAQLVVEMSPTLYRFVSQPAMDPNVHKFTEQVVAGVNEKSWLNLGGDPSTGFVVSIGENSELTVGAPATNAATRFSVVHSVVLRVIEHAHTGMMFDVDATGPPLLVIEDNQVRDLAVFKASGGALQVTEALARPGR